MGQVLSAKTSLLLENAPLFSGFAAGQPDPDQGAANVDNGTATSEAIGPLDLVSGTQATLTIEPLTADAPAPPAAGNGGFAGGAGVAGWQLVALFAVGGTILAAATWTRRRA